ncbi:MAG: hypothetical protein ACREBJ_02710 [Nitrosotalea sp.]
MNIEERCTSFLKHVMKVIKVKNFNRFKMCGVILISLSFMLLIIVSFLNRVEDQYVKSWDQAHCSGTYSCPFPPQTYWYIQPLYYIGISFCIASFIFIIVGTLRDKKKPVQRKQDRPPHDFYS